MVRRQRVVFRCSRSMEMDSYNGKDVCIQEHESKAYITAHDLY
jgi:hypothetical protein